MSEPESIDDVVRSAVANICECDVAEVAMSTLIHDLDIDSLRLIRIVCRVEHAVHRRFNNEEMFEFFLARRVGDLTALIREA